MVDRSQITLPRVMAGLAVLSVIGWVWVITAGSGMPAGIGLLLCAVAPTLLFVLVLYWLNETWLHERPAGKEPPSEG